MIRGGIEGYERLQVLTRARWPYTAELFDAIGVGEGMRALDLGCGGGAVTFEIARIVGPEGFVTGIDMDEVKLDLARAAALEGGVTNVEFRLANVNDWDEVETYDLVFCRFLLEHLSRPLALLRRMWAAVQPGGAIAVEDADFDGAFCDPPNDGYEFWARTYPEVLRRHGGDPQIGRKLYRYFLEAGIPHPTMTLTQDVNTEGLAKTLPLTTVEATADAIRDEKLATEEEISAALASLAAFTDDPSTVVSGPRVFQVWSRRPG